MPKGCGKTGLSMLVPTIPGWTVRCVGDDIAWMHLGEDGRLWAINPEAGFYDVATGTSDMTNKSGMATLRRNTIFTNVAQTLEGDVWWEGMTATPPNELVDWTGQKWTPNCGRPAAHPNSRYTAPASQCPVIDPEWANPNGVPISAFIFGCKRSDTYPLVSEAATWEQGIFLASAIGVEKADTLQPTKVNVHRQPFAMHPFLGYNINHYLKHWLEFRGQLGYNIPKIFVVNWFRKIPGKPAFAWPGFNENSRILKWIHGRTTGSIADGVFKTPIGLVPESSALDLRGLDIDTDQVNNSLQLDKNQLENEMLLIKTYYEELGAEFPKKLWEEWYHVMESLKHI